MKNNYFTVLSWFLPSILASFQAKPFLYMGSQLLNWVPEKNWKTQGKSMDFHGTRIEQQWVFFFFFKWQNPWHQSKKETFLWFSSDCLQTLKMYANFCSLYGYTGLGMFLKEVLTQNVGSLKMATCWMIKVLWQQLDWDEFSFESYIYLLVPLQSRREILV